MSQHYLATCFWNVRDIAAVIPALAEIVAEHQVDVVALAECDMTSGELAQQLTRTTGIQFFSDVLPGGGRITWVYRTSVRISPVFDGDKVSIREITPPLGESILVCAIHASSRLSRDLAELNLLIPRAAAAVALAEAQVGHDRTLVCGDFNLSPFDEGLVSSESFHAVMSRTTAQRGERIVYEEARKFFYNPMWRLLAEDDEVCGTYYFGSNSPLEHFWYCMDQMLFRPSLLENLPQTPVKIVKSTSSHNLIGANGRPRLSDHLPLVGRLTISV